METTLIVTLRLDIKRSGDIGRAGEFRGSAGDREMRGGSGGNRVKRVQRGERRRRGNMWERTRRMGRFHRSGFLRVNASKQSVDIVRRHWEGQCSSN
jgi:hypothetical protein